MTQLLNIEYFRFEEDFMEDNIRCIPMIVRFKLDAIGIKLKLKEWSKMSTDERAQLAEWPIYTAEQRFAYKKYLQQMILTHTGNDATFLPIDVSPVWADTQNLPDELTKKLNELNMQMNLSQWKHLSALQRFALLKLTRPGHENRNFPKAMLEFGLA